MKRALAILTLLFVVFAATAQSENSIIIDQNSFRPVQTDVLTGANVDPISVDSSRRPCARIKVKINRMTPEDINKIDVKIITNNQLTKCKTADYENGLILELTAKTATRFYFNHPEFGQSNEVILNLDPNKEYYMEASLNQLYSIVVNSNVEDAEVYLDNVLKGRTGDNLSCTISDVMIGSHMLKITYGKVSHEQSIEVNKNSISFRQNVNTAASEPQFVVFAVEPATAVVTIDGKHYTLQEGAMRTVLDGGTYNYTVSAVGYHSQSGTFIVSGEKVEKIISLKADAANVTLTVADNAEIWVNGETVGTGRWSGKLNSGTYIFEAKKEGHRATTLSKRITSAQPQQNYTLDTPTPIFGTLMVDGTPLMADVMLDGKPVGRTPLDLKNILVGNHTLKVSKMGYNDYTQTVTVTEGKTATINVTLTKQTTPTKTYKVGDIVTVNDVKGVVFQTSPQVKIVSVAETTAEWGPYGVTTGAIDKNDGTKNMAIIKAISDKKSKYPAFMWCADLGKDWYLPANNELKAICKQKDVIDKTLSANGFGKLGSKDKYSHIWSSTGNRSDGAYGIFFSDGSVGYYDKDHLSAVRAILTLDDTTESIASGKVYEIGDYYNDGVKEGVVFEVSADGKHGKIVSMTESNNDLNYNEEAMGWYLPTLQELRKVFKCQKKLNVTLKEKSAKEIKFPYVSSTRGYPGLGNDAPAVVLNAVFEQYVRKENSGGYARRAVSAF